METIKKNKIKKVNMNLFHVTKEENYVSIKKEGLIPLIGENSKKMNENIPAIYFFKNLESVQDALSGWLSDCFSEEEKLIILEVKIKDESIINNSEAEYELIVNQKISKDLISLKNVDWI